MHTFFGQTRQFRQQLESHWQPMYRVCFSWCHDPELSADLVQESIETALVNHQRFTDAEYLKKWLFTVLVNKWRDHCRQARPHTDMEHVTLAHDNTPEAEHLHDEAIQRMFRAMSQISVDHREVLSLVAIQGFSYEEVASMLDIPAGTVMSRLCRARQQLRKILAESEKNTTSDNPIRRIK